MEKKQNTTISEIFATKGEEAFRDMETETVKSYQILLITASYLLVADLC
ncbi:MAG: shikimate kinase [Lachnospira pectinoschiza]